MKHEIRLYKYQEDFYSKFGMRYSNSDIHDLQLVKVVESEDGITAVLSEDRISMLSHMLSIMKDKARCFRDEDHPHCIEMYESNIKLIQEELNDWLEALKKPILTKNDITTLEDCS